MKIQTFSSNSSKDAFSLVELAVLVAIVTLLSSLFFAAALSRARQHSSETGCLNNLRRLTLGWQMYATDNRGNLPVNADEGGQPNLGNLLTLDRQWCPGRMDAGATPGAPTNAAWIKAGQIYPYVGDVQFYRCPADVSTCLGASAYPLGGKGNPRLRSYSMNAWIGTAPGSVSTIGSATSSYRLYSKESDLAVPGPANLFLLVEENPFSINDGFFMEIPSGSANPPTANSWVDIPAAYHAGAAGISFCDGHAQIRKWTDANLLASKSTGIPAAAPRTDLLWLLQHSTAHK